MTKSTTSSKRSTSAPKSIKSKVAIIAVAVLIFAFILYVCLPTLSIFYFGSLFFIAFVVACSALVVYLFSNKIKLNTVTKQSALGKQTTLNVTYIGDKKTRVTRIVALVAAGILVLAILLGLASTAMFRAKEYHGILGNDLQEADFSQTFKEITTENVTDLINIDSSLAERKATTLFGEIKGFGSAFQLGMFTDQIVNGKFVTVAPIEYNGFFKYMANSAEGAPGYVIVDKQNFTNQTGSEIIMDRNYKYMPSSYFGTDLLRHVYFSGYANYEMTIGGFEINDNGEAFWVVNIYQNRIYPLGGRMITKVLLVNPIDGHIDEYALADVPAWVDNVQDSDIIMNRVNQYGELEKGFLNSMFAQTGVVRSTEGSRHIVIDGELYLFTGMTSVGADESISQIILVNKRTLQATICDVSGATEYAAMSSAEGKLQNYGYTATFPLPVNVNGVPTYFIPLKDDLGLIKNYAFVRVSNHSIIGSGETVQSAYTSYLSLVSGESTENLTTVTGDVYRINIVGNMAYIMMDDGNIYYMSDDNLSLYLTQAGDNVTISVAGSQIINFANNTLADHVAG